MFLKTLGTPSGALAEYWHRARVVLTDAGLTIELHGYMDPQAKADGKTKLADMSFFVGRDRFAALGLPDFTALTRSIIRAVAPDFVDAVDALVEPPPEEPQP
jgi:hypothetical protein